MPEKTPMSGDPYTNGTFWVDPDETLKPTIYPAEPKTQEIEIVGQTESYDTDEINASETDEGQRENVYWFRRHFREPLLRLLPTKQSPRAYIVLGLIGLICIVVAAVVAVQMRDAGVGIIGIAIGLVFFAYPLCREIYRWRSRTVVIERSGLRIKITYGEPDSFLLAFEGSGDGDSITIEGSMGLTKKIGWTNKLIFWGCGDLLISGKIEGKAPSDIYNVPKIKKVMAFLEGGT